MFDGRLSLAIFLGKLVFFFSRLLGGGGTAAPGWLALFIEPQLIRKFSSQLKKNILITGTNGKTTIARMLTSILKQKKIKFIHNRAGSNLLRGIASTFISYANVEGNLPPSCWGVWEIDEAVFAEACNQLKPQVVLINNLFRDQLDRYGEIDILVKSWQSSLKKLPTKTRVILNADDASVASLGKNLKNKVVYFGLKDKKLKGEQPKHASDATLCPYCFSNLNYQLCFVGHLGLYTCPLCGQIQPKKNVLLKSLKNQTNLQKSVEFTIDSKGSLKLITSLPGNYNLYNLTATIALASNLGIEKETIVKGLHNFKPAFGRVEKIKIAGKVLNIFLVKNPTGFNEVINTLIQLPMFGQFPTPGVRKNYLIAINDLIADGRDVSWLWDVNFEKFVPQIKSAIISGIRAHDMALRLKYAGIKSEMTIEPNLKKAVKKLLLSEDKNLYILPTYTAMLSIRKILFQMGLTHSSWED